MLLTGHTGFKGSWMSMLLSDMGANVYGYALEPESTPNIFDICNIPDLLSGHYIGDIRDSENLKKVIARIQPDVIIHMAAQSLVRRGYSCPIETYDVNVMGTARLLDAARVLSNRCAIVVVTTDKVYANNEEIYPFRETDPLGSVDPYSSSKAACELVTDTWRRSFFQKDSRLEAASVRAGNVIGGGDWAEDRLVPDCIRSLMANNAIQIRNPGSVRPWQHALEPIIGYMIVAENLYNSEKKFDKPSWNFGPDISVEMSVKDVVSRIIDCWGSGSFEVFHEDNAPKEAQLLRLDSSKAKLELGWKPIWGFDQTITETVSWYKSWKNDDDMLDVSLAQIHKYLAESGICENKVLSA